MITIHKFPGGAESENDDSHARRVMGCDARCWTPVLCTRCARYKQPRGRSVPPEAAGGYCDWDCPGYAEEPKAPHLFSEHDSTRAFSDPEGWKAHETQCPECTG